MRPDAVARRYARAIFQLADQQNAIDDVARALAAMASLLDDEQVARVLTGPVPREQKQQLLRSLAGDIGAPPALRDLLLLLAERDRLDHVGAIRDVFDALVDRRRNRTRARVRSAMPLASDLIAELTRVFGGLTGKEVIPEIVVEPELLAGVIVEIEGKVYDGTLQTQLGKLRRQMAIGN